MAKKERFRRLGWGEVEVVGEVPEPPTLKNFLLYIGPVMMIFGLGLGLSELVLYPHLTVKYGIGWIGWMILGLFFQTLWAMELSRWVVIIGENAAQQHARVFGKWGAAFLIVIPMFVAMGIPAWASSAGTALWHLIHFPPDQKVASVVWAIATFLFTFLLIVFSRVARKYVEILVLITTALAFGILIVASIIAVPLRVWRELWNVVWFPRISEGMNLWTFGSTLAWVGAGSTLLWYTYWMKDAGWGMSARFPSIPGWLGQKVKAPLVGAVVESNARNSTRLIQWLSRSHFVLWGIYFIGNLLTFFFIIGLSQVILAPAGLVPEGFDVLNHQALFFEKVLGPAGKIIFLAMAWFLVMNTQAAISEALMRQNTDLTIQLFPSLSPRMKELYFGWWGIYLLFAVAVLVAPFFIPGANPFRYITTAAGFSFIALMFSMLASLTGALWFPRFISRKIRANVAPSFWTIVLLTIGFVFHLYWLLRAFFFLLTKT